MAFITTFSIPPFSPHRSSTLRDPLWSPDCPTSPPPSYAASVASEASTIASPNLKDYKQQQQQQQPTFSSEIYIPAKSSSSASSSGKDYSRKDSVPLSKNIIMEEKGGRW